MKIQYVSSLLCRHSHYFTFFKGNSYVTQMALCITVKTRLWESHSSPMIQVSYTLVQEFVL